MKQLLLIFYGFIVISLTFVVMSYGETMILMDRDSLLWDDVTNWIFRDGTPTNRLPGPEDDVQFGDVQRFYRLEGDAFARSVYIIDNNLGVREGSSLTADETRVFDGGLFVNGELNGNVNVGTWAFLRVGETGVVRGDHFNVNEGSLTIEGLIEAEKVSLSDAFLRRGENGRIVTELLAVTCNYCDTGNDISYVYTISPILAPISSNDFFNAS